MKIFVSNVIQNLNLHRTLPNCFDYQTTLQIPISLLISSLWKSIRTTHKYITLATIALPSKKKRRKRKEKKNTENAARPRSRIGQPPKVASHLSSRVVILSSRYCRKPDFRARMDTANVCGWASCVEKGVASPLPLSHGTSGRTRADHGTASSNGVPPDDPRNPETS